MIYLTKDVEKDQRYKMSTKPKAKEANGGDLARIRLQNINTL